MKEVLTRRIFLKRASQACGVLVMLPAARSIGKLSMSDARNHACAAYYEHTILAMGTTARMGVYAASEEEANHVITEAFNELKRLEALFTIFDASSEISKLNAEAGGRYLSISSEVSSILSKSVEVSKITDKAFDVTVEPLMRLWGFRNNSNILTQLPSADAIASAVRLIGSNQIELRATQTTPAARLRNEGAKIDLGGIAVGYALDAMIAIIKHAGIERAFIDISGDMFALGAPHGHDGWDVAVPDPRDTRKLIYRTRISNEALATSGNYMSYVVFQAQKYGHIMDPRVGHSADRVLSATVIAKCGLDADALSTASFVTGETYSDSKVILVNRSGAVRA
ncbi:MAG: FAD:protein FMN transferase [Bacteroidota bacterium]|nr:FAD:protein FMN transferase [Bacteroidota bacterium]MDP4233165.1 FAD:protein FMN transferase [Bacteroidota bacterium]MDP4241690.1 FAD:protein FMN transferase [Bacteroidota bacterium]MDP4287348.1 FAD:protein FMN transferase [Bacteroidota bacterium]